MFGSGIQSGSRSQKFEAFISHCNTGGFFEMSGVMSDELSGNTKIS